MTIQQYLTIGGAIITAASMVARAVTAATGTPPRSTLWGKVYMAIEFLAVTTTKTKEHAPDSPAAGA